VLRFDYNDVPQFVLAFGGLEVGWLRFVAFLQSGGSELSGWYQLPS
jgi:hypothetical protein